MNYALETDLVCGFPHLFTKGAEVDISVGWFPLVEAMLQELGTCNLKISKIEEDSVLDCSWLSVVTPISLVDEDKHIEDILKKYRTESMNTCSISGEYTQPKPFQEN